MIRWAALLALPLAAGPAESIDQLFSRMVQPGQPGCAITVVEKGKPVLIKTYGQANLEHDIPINQHTAFYLGSTSKQFTALATLLLASQGHIKLDDPVHRYLPRLPVYMKPVTVRHLLEHSSGIRDYVGLWTLSAPPDDAPLTDMQVNAMLQRQQKLNFQPGAEFLYSNSGYFLLSQIIPPVARGSLAAYAAAAIFQPLGLRNTLFYNDRFQLLPKRATAYSPGGGGFRINSATIDVAGDGGVFTTIDDLSRWIATLDSAPNEGIAKALSLMRTPAQLNGGGIPEYGRGLMLKTLNGTPIESHAGGLRGYRSEILFVPSAHLGVACLCNRSDMNVTQLARQIASFYLPAPSPPKPPSLTAADLQRKLGSYRDLDSGDLLVIEPGPTGLSARFHGGSLQLTPVEPLRFRAVNAPIDFELQFTKNGDKDIPSFLRVESEMHRPLRLEPAPPPPAGPLDGAPYQGVYFSPEAAAKLQIRWWESRLTIEQTGTDGREISIGQLQPTGPDRFAFSTMNLTFVRGAGQKITGFELNTGRVRGLQFQYTGEPLPD